MGVGQAMGRLHPEPRRLGMAESEAAVEDVAQAATVQVLEH